MTHAAKCAQGDRIFIILDALRRLPRTSRYANLDFCAVYARSGSVSARNAGFRNGFRWLDRLGGGVILPPYNR